MISQPKPKTFQAYLWALVIQMKLLWVMLLNLVFQEQTACEYWPNAQIKNKQTTNSQDDGQTHGIYRWWDQDGQLTTKTHFKNGEKDGEMVQYHLSSGGFTQSFWKDGKSHGPRTTYHNKDKLIESVFNYKEGKLHGEEKWCIKGKLIMVVVHEDGVPKTKKSWPLEGTPGFKFNHYYENGEWLPIQV